MGILDLLLGSDPSALSSLLKMGPQAVGMTPPLAQPGANPPPQMGQAPGGVPQQGGMSGGLLGNGFLGNAARGALYGMGAAGTPGPSGFLAGVGRGAQQSIGMQQQQQQFGMQRDLYNARAEEWRSLAEQRQQQAQARQQQQQYVDQAISQLPPAEQMRARAFPEQFAKTLFPESDKSPAAIQEYQYYTQQEQAAGRKPLSFNEWNMQTRKASAPSTSVTVGGANIYQPTPLTNSTQTNLQEKQFNEVDALANLKAIEGDYNAKYQTWAERGKQMISSWKELAGMPLDSGTQQSLQDYTRFKSNAYTYFNKNVKILTGTAISPGEAERFKMQMPVAGQGLFDGDSPTQFKTKMDESIRLSKLAIMRYHYALNRHIDPLQTGIELTDMPHMIDQRGDDIERELKKAHPDWPQPNIDAQVHAMIGQEFGQ